jgi:hypothetical protein
MLGGMDDNGVITVRDLRRRYGGTGGRGFDAVRGVTFSVRRGELFALLGTNGAGKTSTMEPDGRGHQCGDQVAAHLDAGHAGGNTTRTCQWSRDSIMALQGAENRVIPPDLSPHRCAMDLLSWRCAAI